MTDMELQINTPSLNWWRLLPVGTMKCPKDEEPLHWEVFGGMRIRRQSGKASIYQARCPKCSKQYEVFAPKERS